MDVFQTRLAVQISITSCFLVPFLACKVLFSAQGAKIELVIDRRIDFHEKSIFCLSSWVRHESPNKRQRASEARFGSDPFQQISQGKRDHDWPNSCFWQPNSLSPQFQVQKEPPIFILLSRELRFWTGEVNIYKTDRHSFTLRKNISVLSHGRILTYSYRVCFRLVLKRIREGRTKEAQLQLRPQVRAINVHLLAAS